MDSLLVSEQRVRGIEMRQIDNSLSLRRVTKRTARKLLAQAHAVFVCPCNVRIDSPWGLRVAVSGDESLDQVFYGLPSSYGRYNAYYVHM